MYNYLTGTDGTVSIGSRRVKRIWALGAASGAATVVVAGGATASIPEGKEVNFLPEGRELFPASATVVFASTAMYLIEFDI